MRAHPHFAAVILALALSPLTAGCGFTPMYATSHSGAPAIGPVLVDEVPGKAGFELKAELDRMFDAERGTGPVHRLSVKMTESVAGLGYRLDESATRADLVLNAKYVLYDADGKEVFSGNVQTLTTYDVPGSAYGELAAQDDARTRGAGMMAEQLRTELALKLARLRAEKASKAEKKG